MAARRPRSSSVQQVVEQVSQLPLGQTNYSQAEKIPDVTATADPRTKGPGTSAKGLKPWEEPSKGFWDDLKTMKWMRYPCQRLCSTGATQCAHSRGVAQGRPCG